MSNESEDKLKTNIRQTLDDSAASLDANTLSRIRQVRAQAVDKAQNRRNDWLTIMTGALATACVMVFVVMVLLKSPAPMQTSPLDDLDLISSSDSLELYEDLEFYEWLEEDVLQS